ncbi:tyrosine-type recombinase/integrase [Criibacterium bergeronii]|uniref:Site-specific integrase n=1 Tax=Criibacterium bergeronii TaxID=1871336 RepID=A0A371IJV1_9FIRM|nr:tyrosine-type recombinase/integrase [Criibacterium bergeronii]RDY20746.1 site-specific integrase [Criibacterium bergeronii]
MNITYREKDGSIQAIISYKQTGKWKQKSKQGFKTKKQAKQWAEKQQYSIMEDKQNGIETNEMTISQALEIYLNYKKNIVKYSSYEIIKTRLKILEPIQNIEVSKIKPIQITNLIQSMQETGHYYKNEIQTIKTYFEFCKKELKIIKENPVNIPRTNKKRQDKRIKYIDTELYQTILSNIQNKKEKLLIKMMYNTGMRKSELLGLKYDDIKDSIITVTRQKYNGTITTLKTQNGYRQIPIPQNLYNEIKQIKIKNIDGFIFDTTTAKKTEYKLKKYNTSFHCFRHTYATNLVAKNINLKVASEILGDKFETFVNTYVQTSKIEQEKAYKKIINE